MTQPEIRSTVCPPAATNTYLLTDPQTRKTSVIDPGMDSTEAIVSICAEFDLILETIFLTHGHIDHIAGVQDLLQHQKLPILAHPGTALYTEDSMQNGAMWMGIPYEPFGIDQTLSEGDPFQVGNLTFQLLETPGHLPASLCVYGYGVCFPGDLIFHSAVGRWDLPGGDEPTLQKSLRYFAEQMPDETQLYPGHGPKTTMGRERKHNPFLLEWL